MLNAQCSMNSESCRAGSTRTPSLPMDAAINLALIGAGMFGGDVHLRSYADLHRAGISANLGRVGLDDWARDLAPIKFRLIAVATRSEDSARHAQAAFKTWTGH